MTLIYPALCFQMNNRLRHLSLSLLCLVGSNLYTSATHAGDVMVAVASNFIKPMQSIADEFEASTGHKVKISFGSSGKLLAQIVYGAPFELFLSADTDKVERLMKLGLAQRDSAFVYAKGRLVLWSKDENYIDKTHKVLQQGNFKYLALADGKLAPYGKAANEVIQSLALNTHLRDRLVTGENISQTYQFVETSNAELGFVALSQVRQLPTDKQGSSWVVPASLHQPIQQSAGLLKRGANNPAATELLKFLQQKTTQALIESFGYETPKTITAKSYADSR